MLIHSHAITLRILLVLPPPRARTSRCRWPDRDRQLRPSNDVPSRARARPGRRCAAGPRWYVPVERWRALHSGSSLGSFLLAGLEEVLQSVEASGPEPLVEGKPVGGGGERTGVQPAHVAATINGAADQSRPLEDLYVFRSCRE